MSSFPTFSPQYVDVADYGEVSISAIVPEVDTPADNGTTNGNDPAEIDPSQRWRAMEKILARASPFGAETGLLPTGAFQPFENVSCSSVKLRYSRHVFFNPIDYDQAGGCGREARVKKGE